MVCITTIIRQKNGAISSHALATRRQCMLTECIFYIPVLVHVMNEQVPNLCIQS